MLCIVTINPSYTSPKEAIKGWLLAIDISDARRQAHSVGLSRLAALLDQESDLPPGKHFLCPDDHGREYWALVN